MIRPALAFLVALGLAASVLNGAQQPQFRAAAPTVSIYATVLDRNGDVVTDLKRDDFEVFDNGRPQPLTVFDNGLRPITIVVMLDRSGSVRAHFGLVRDAAKAFVANMLPGDRVRIGSFADRIRIDPATFTEDPVELHRILDHELLPAGATPLWNATSQALDALSEEEGRRVVLVFTDGRDTPMIGPNVFFRDLLHRVREEETMLYAIGLSYECADTSRTSREIGTGGIRYQGGRGGPFAGPRPPQIPGLGPQFPIPGTGRGPAPRPPFPIPRPGSGPWRPSVEICRETGPDPDLRALADVGGGGYFELRSTDNLASTFERVAYELHSQYLLAFTAPELDGDVHQLDVRVKRRGVTVRARKSYLAHAE